MSIFDVDPVKPEITVESKQALLKYERLLEAKALRESNIRYVKETFNALWSNPQGLTPQEAFDAFSTDAVLYWNRLVAVATSINAITPGAVNVTPPKQLTLNQDGTVTVED